MEAYFACAEYQNVYSRVAVNVSGAAAFWLDIDCGKAKAASRKGYLNVSDAETAIDKFCIDTGLPKPTHIVYTGGGLHGYWVLDRGVLRELWKPYAGKLKALTQALGLLADGSRTADIASVLRVPGTLNYKYDPPRPVVLKFAADQFIETSAMLDAIDSAYNRPCEVTGTVSNCCSYITSNATTSKSGTPDRKRLSSQPSTTGPTADHVHLLRVIMSRPDPDCGYDDWTHAGMALSFETGGSADGFAIYDAWSSTGEKYDGANATAAKWKSFQSDLKRTFTIRTLFWMAVKEGCTVEDIYAEAEPFKICGGENGRS